MNFSKLDTFIKQMPLRGIPAAELAVTKDGKTVYHACVGYSDANKTKPADEHDLYWIYSSSKVITCLAAMRLVEEGRLRLEDPVAKYIPEFTHMTVLQPDGTLVPAQTPMTVLHLFTMTGGMTYDMNTEALRSVISPTVTTLELVRAMAKDPLMFEPGTNYRYSLCHDVLAAVVEVIVGMPFSKYVEELMFKPLGLTNIGFHPSEEQKQRFSALYRFQNGIGIATPCACENAYNLSDRYDSGGAGIFSSVNDYIKIISVIACGGTADNGYTLLKPETIRMMQVNYLNDAGRKTFSAGRLYGYGWGLCGRVHMDPIVSLSLSPVGEFGWDGAANSFNMIDPENRIALYYGAHVLGSVYGYNILHPAIRNLVYEGLNS
ncbi:MAG: beta-lactamase family protein [Ruminococcaceae bacterium]|nr:beta-lactamase family protein [Oscillospiraceae bacterium]